MKNKGPEIEMEMLARDRGPEIGRPKNVVYIEESPGEIEDSFKQIFDNVNAVIVRLNNRGIITEINAKVEQMYGFTREEILGKHFTRLGVLTNKDLLRMVKLFNDAVKVKQAGYHDVLETRDKAGNKKYVDLNCTVVKKNGRIDSTIAIIHDITERKKSEESLRESEEKFSKAFLVSPGAISIATVKDGRFIDVNESFSRVMGYTRAEAIGRTSTELNIFAEDEGRDKLLDDLKLEGRTYNKTIKFRRKSGEIGSGLFSAEKIVINNEPCIISVNMDITEQKKAEESLRLLGSVTQQVTDSIVVNDPDFKITYMNKAAQNLFGYSIDEVLGTDISLFDGMPISKKVREDIRNSINLGKTWTAVLSKRHKDGSTFLCDCRRSPMFDEDGRLISYIAVYRDITEQKEIEAKLQAQKKMVESIVTSMPEGVLVTDTSDRIVLANESFRKIFRTGVKVIDNKLLNEVLRVGQLFDLYSSIKSGNSDTHSLEFRCKVKDLEKIIACVIVKMDSERMLLIFSDVSREREEEDKLYLTDRLASLGVMAAGLAHELNNPLTGILTLSQLLVNSDLPDEHKEDLQCVYSEAKRAANIVKNVLLFTRNNSYENGKSSVNEVAKEVLRLREHEVKVKNIDIETDFQDDLPEIQLDKYQLQQVFLNIILNAEAAIEEAKRPGTLKITTEKVNNHVHIMFTDTGCGIKKQDLPRIFDPFFTTKEIGKGTGLGLSICYGIIMKHNGKLSVKTQVGKGTTFTITLPVAN